MSSAIDQFHSISSLDKVWYPDEHLIEQANIHSFLTKNNLKNIEELHEQSLKYPQWFYESILAELDIPWIGSYENYLNIEKGIAFPEWFSGGKTNILHYTIEKHIRQGKGEYKALTWEGEKGESTSYTFREFNKKINELAAALRSIGIEKGDRVGIYLPTIPEAPISMFACAKIGAIVIPVFSGYGADAVAIRMKEGKAKLLITADGYTRRGRLIEMKSEADRAAAIVPDIEHVLVVEYANAEISWNEGRDVSYSELIAKHKNQYVDTAILEADDPFMIMYTSGTTGKPKGTVHTHTGFPLKAAIDQYLCFDLKKTDKFFWFTDFGWMMGPWLFLGSAVHGAEVIMYEGSPDFPHEGRLWELINRHQITVFGISPTLIRSLMTKEGKVPSLPSLRILGSTGEAWNPEAWQWFLEQVGKDRCPIINYSGGTEVSGGILGTYPTKPIKICSFHGPIPGMAAAIVDDGGKQVQNTVGDLTLNAPFLGMTKSFWEDDERYIQAYWSRWPDIWAHGDFAAVDQDGYWYLLGRSDDTIKVAGKRLGPSEMEAAITSHPDVKEAAAISIPHEIKGEAPVVFAVLHSSADSTPSLENELLAQIEKVMGKALKPQAVHIITELPYTQSNKIARRVIRAAYLGSERGDTSTLKNQAILDEITRKGNEDDINY
ncbi:AMP-binding protein [Cytobacillus purgationiresistens]|uniref:acetate--CoA ligase n=1 Tax=Cytobacillus purgationiresistens TaxID=863449 RepID=A0ABU0ANV5_9BACI|nr:AMP-binding protein [Cytobacillus purgationiresistens]MDQ0272875.1 acetyl-CoA synthetase [Cytobacillus purgationiresistens]